MGQWGQFSQIKHEAYPETLSHSASVSVRCWWAGRREMRGLEGGEKS